MEPRYRFEPPAEARLWLPEDATYECEGGDGVLWARIRFGTEEREAAWQLALQRDREADRGAWPFCSPYFMRQAKRWMGGDLWSFVFELQDVNRQCRDPTLTLEEVKEMTGWRETKAKEYLRRLKSRQIDSEISFQIAKLYIPGIRPAPHWHGPGSAPAQFILLDGDVILDQQTLCAFSRDSGRLALQIERLTGGDQPQLFHPDLAVAPAAEPARGRKTTPYPMEPYFKGSESDPLRLDSDPLKSESDPLSEPPFPPAPPYPRACIAAAAKESETKVESPAAPSEPVSRNAAAAKLSELKGVLPAQAASLVRLSRLAPEKALLWRRWLPDVVALKAERGDPVRSVIAWLRHHLHGDCETKGPCYAPLCVEPEEYTTALRRRATAKRAVAPAQPTQGTPRAGVEATPRSSVPPWATLFWETLIQAAPREWLRDLLKAGDALPSSLDRDRRLLTVQVASKTTTQELGSRRDVFNAALSAAHPGVCEQVQFVYRPAAAGSAGKDEAADA